MKYRLLLILLPFFFQNCNESKFNTNYSPEELEILSEEEPQLIDTLYTFHTSDTVKPSVMKHMLLAYRKEYDVSYLTDTLRRKGREEFWDVWLEKMRLSRSKIKR